MELGRDICIDGHRAVGQRDLQDGSATDTYARSGCRTLCLPRLLLAHSTASTLSAKLTSVCLYAQRDLVHGRLGGANTKPLCWRGVKQHPLPVCKLVVLQGDGEVPNAVAVRIIDESLLPCSEQGQKSCQTLSMGAPSACHFQADFMPDASRGLNKKAVSYCSKNEQCQM